MKRKHPLINNKIYHITNKSIAGYEIFNKEEDYKEMVLRFLFYSFKIDRLPSFSRFKSLAKTKKLGFKNSLKRRVDKDDKLVKIIAYCIMPTHIHLVLKQLKNDGISNFMGNVSNSYTRYFNLKHNRKGSLWQRKFKNIPVTSDEQLIHLTRYIHLNPVTAGLVENPTKWQYSSYNEYINDNPNIKICDFDNEIEIKPKEYKKFVNARKNYQRELSKIKNIIIE